MVVQNSCQGLAPARHEAVLVRAAGIDHGFHRRFRQGFRTRHPLRHQGNPQHQHQACHQADCGKAPAQDEAHEHQGRRVEHRVGNPERQCRAHRDVLSTHPGRYRCRAARTHHAGQGEQTAAQGRGETGATEQAQQPVAGNQHLQQRAEDHRQYRGFPDRQEVHLGIGQRGGDRRGRVVVDDRGADAVAVGGYEGLGVVGRPFDVIQADGGDGEKQQRFPPERPASGGGGLGKSGHGGVSGERDDG